MLYVRFPHLITYGPGWGCPTIRIHKVSILDHCIAPGPTIVKEHQRTNNELRRTMTNHVFVKPSARARTMSANSPLLQELISRPQLYSLRLASAWDLVLNPFTALNSRWTRKYVQQFTVLKPKLLMCATVWYPLFVCLCAFVWLFVDTVYVCTSNYMHQNSTLATRTKQVVLVECILATMMPSFGVCQNEATGWAWSWEDILYGSGEPVESQKK